MSGRRGDGEGSIYRAADGSWRGSIRLGTDFGETPIRRHVRGRTKAEVREKLERLKREHDGGVRSSTRPMTVSNWLVTWLGIQARIAKPSTLKTYRTHVKYAIAAFGARTWTKMTPEIVERMYDDLLERGLKPISVAGVHRTLRSAGREGVRRGHFARSPFDRARPGRVQEEEIVPFTAAEGRAILEVAASRRNAARWYVGLVEGLRQGEALGLQWDDIGWQAETLRVRRALQRLGPQHGCDDPEDCGSPVDCPHRRPGGLVVVEPKSKSAIRTIKLTSQSLKALKVHRAAQAEERLAAGELWLPPPPNAGLNSGSGWVFATVTGGPTDPKRDWEAWKEILVEAQVHDARLHDARHSACSFLLASGLDARIVMDRFGWTHSSMLARYQHVLPEIQEEAARRLEGFLFGDETV